jgi:tetratricopeptide (TPR) repeat protein
MRLGFGGLHRVGMALGAALLAGSYQSAPDAIVRRWVAAVQEHAAGAFDGPARAVAAWPDHDLDSALFHVTAGFRILAEWGWPAALEHASVRAFGLSAPADAQRLARRGAILHADVAMMAPRQSAPELSASARRTDSAVLVRDGEAVGWADYPGHWRFGRALLLVIQPTPAGRTPRGAADDPFARLWFRATTAYLANWQMLSEVEAHTRQGIFSLPGDAVLLLFAGALHEQRGSPVLQNFLRSAPLPPRTTLAIGSAPIELDLARRRLERAIDADPSLAEAHVRLGRVLGLSGDHAAAIRSLQRAESVAVDPRWKYFAAMFLGAEQEQRQRVAEARQAYTRAAARYPRAQSPLLALGRLATEAGDRETAATASHALLTLSPDPEVRDDPWWTYALRPRADLERLLAEYYPVARAVR